MKRWLLLVLCLAVIATWFGCNKQKPLKLDYSEQEKQGEYEAVGLPGDSYVGAPDVATKHTDHLEGIKTECDCPDKDKDKKPAKTKE